MAIEQRGYPGAAAPTALSADITAGQTTITVTAGGGTGYADGSGGPGILVIDAGTSKEEKVRYTSRSGDTFTVPVSNGRGFDGTAASAHSAGAVVAASWSADDAATANLTAVQTLGKITAKGDLLTGSAPNLLTRTTVGANGLPLVASSGSAGGVVWAGINQSVSHNTPDTDVAQTSLHHTLGGGHNQAAAGDHTHAADATKTSETEFLATRSVGTATATSETTSSTGWTDLLTVGPVATLIVPTSGIVTVLFGCAAGNSGAFQSLMSFQVDDGTTSTTVLAPNDLRSWFPANPNATAQNASACSFYPVSGLTPGHTVTVTAKYRVTGGIGTFFRRVLTLLPSA